MAKTFLITGVSSGFGRALAEVALSDGHTVAGTVHNDADKQKFEVAEKSLAQNLGQPSLIGIGI